MRVGVNYPWVDYGWDFGLAPSSWRSPGADPRWLTVIDDDLRRFRGLGISVVRWFILADGFTYGSGNEAPWKDPVRPDTWHFEPPRLSADALEHFDTLLARIDSTNQASRQAIQLLPVLVDFQFCQSGCLPVGATPPTCPTGPPGDPAWVKRGRAETILDPGKRRRFLDGVLDPLLRVSHAHASAIFAWELINEPEWVTTGWHPDGQPHPVDPASMRAFLDDGKARIRQFAMKPTIGFALIDTIRRTGITAEINQFHHYPGGARALEPHVFSHQAPGIVGEFAASGSDRWPDLPSDKQTVLERLRLAAQRGYPVAIPWSYRQVDQHAEWTAAVERDLDAFAREQPGVMVQSDAISAEESRADERVTETSVPLRCAAETVRGTQCRRRAVAGTVYCWQHQPDAEAIRTARTTR